MRAVLQTVLSGLLRLLQHFLHEFRIEMLRVDPDFRQRLRDGDRLLERDDPLIRELADRLERPVLFDFVIRDVFDIHVPSHRPLQSAVVRHDDDAVLRLLHVHFHDVVMPFDSETVRRRRSFRRVDVVAAMGDVFDGIR